MSTCYSCGAQLPREIFRATTCEQCNADAHVCRNCTFYEPGAHWDCHETIPEAVHDKERANFCDYFRAAVSRGSEGGRGNRRDAADGARSQLDKLFGDG